MDQRIPSPPGDGTAPADATPSAFAKTQQDLEPSTGSSAMHGPPSLGGLVDPGISALSLPTNPRYTLRGRLGAGATGQVMLAHDQTFDREVAMKVMIGRGGPAAARFVREARITASLEHPGIVPIHDLDFTPGGAGYFTMRRIVGRSLGELLADRRAGKPAHPAIANTNAIVTLIRKVLDTLARAHDQGIIHQDLKPDNLMLGDYGEAVVVDWGEARIKGESGVRKARTVGTPAYMSPEQARGEHADERSDLYGLGSTMFHLLFDRPPFLVDDQERFWQGKKAGAIQLPDATALARVDRRLMAILLRALAADPAERYQDARALAGDLDRFQAGQSVEAYREGVVERTVRLLRRHLRLLGNVLFVLLVLAGAVWFAAGERIKEMAFWGSPVVDETFSTPAIDRHWLPPPEGTWTIDQGRLRNTASNAALLVLRQRLTAPVAIEFDGEILPEGIPCDLSVWWTDADAPGTTEDTFFPPGANGWQIQPGAFANSMFAIFHMPGRARVAHLPRKLDQGRIYRIRVELEGQEVRLLVDGELALSCRDIFPVTSGHLAIYTYYPGKAFDNVRVYAKGVAQKVDVLTVGDSWFQAGSFTTAAREYRRVVESVPAGELAERARYRWGLAEWKSGNGAQASGIWDALTDQELSDRATAHRISSRWNAGERRSAIDALAFLYDTTSHAEVRLLLRQLWVEWAAALANRRPVDMEPLSQELLRLRESRFGDDGASGWEAASLLWSLGRWQEILDHFSSERMHAANAHQAQGRQADLLRDQGTEPWVRDNCRLQLGLLDELLADPRTSTNSRTFALCKAGRAEEALATLPSSSMTLTHLGRTAEAVEVASASGSIWHLIAALNAHGALTAAAEPADPLQPSSFYAAAMLGRVNELIPRNDRLWHQAQWLEAARRNDPAGADLAREVLRQPVDRTRYDGWFLPWFGLPMASMRNGDPGAWQTSLERIARDEGPQFAHRPRVLAERIQGRISDQVVLDQPYRSEAQAWLHLAHALAAEAAHDDTAALAAYRRFTDLPPQARLLNGSEPDALVELFVRWRSERLSMSP